MNEYLSEREQFQPGMMVYFETLDLMNSLTDSEIGALIRGGMTYVRGMKQPLGLTEHASLFWPIVRRELDRDILRYREKCRRYPRKKQPDLYVPYDPAYDDL